MRLCLTTWMMGTTRHMMLRDAVMLLCALACTAYAAQSPTQAPQSLRGAPAVAPSVSEPVPFDTQLKVGGIQFNMAYSGQRKCCQSAVLLL